MYLEFFKLNKKPFDLSPDPRFLFLSDKHSIALAMLEYGIYEQSGLTVLTGDVGMGKTTLLRQLLTKMDGSKVRVGLINNTHAEFGSLLEWVCLAFDIDAENTKPVEKFGRIQKYLIDQYSLGKRSLLIIDEAQNLSKDQLEQVRLLTNINSENDLLLHVMLIGQPQLYAVLDDPDLLQITQRISSEYHLTPLDLEDTNQYILHRLAVAGQKQALFNDAVIAGIHYYSGGTPRLINKICDYCLVVSFSRGDKYVAFDTLVEVLLTYKNNGAARLKHMPTNSTDIRRAILEVSNVDLQPVSEDIPVAANEFRWQR